MHDIFSYSPREWSKIVAKELILQGKTIDEFEASARCDTYTLDLHKKMVIEEMRKVRQ